MSTTTERSPLRRIATWTAWAVLALAVWAVIMLALPFAGPPGRMVAVVGRPATAATAVSRAGGRIVEIRSGVVLARSPDRDFAWRFYRAGALVVLEGNVAAGCLGIVDQAASPAGANAGA